MPRFWFSYFPTKTGTFVLCTEAPLSGIGAVLSQNQGGYLKTKTYAIKTSEKGQRDHYATNAGIVRCCLIYSLFSRVSIWLTKN